MQPWKRCRVPLDASFKGGALTDTRTTPPKGVTPPELLEEESNGKFVERLMFDGKAFAVAGHSLVGKGAVILSVGMYQFTGWSEDGKVPGAIRGWTFFRGHPDYPNDELLRVDSGSDEADEAEGDKKIYLAFPNAMTDVGVEFDEALLAEDADQEHLMEIVEWALAQCDG